LVWVGCIKQRTAFPLGGIEKPLSACAESVRAQTCFVVGELRQSLGITINRVELVLFIRIPSQEPNQMAIKPLYSLDSRTIRGG
jgi:hypothetical protein